MEWLQNRIAEKIKKRLDKLKGGLLREEQIYFWTYPLPNSLLKLRDLVEKTEIAYLYILHPKYRQELEKWEPWRLDKVSLARDTNLSLRIVRGYSGKYFLDWVKQESQKYNVSRDVFLAGIIETIRKIAWETIKIMGEKNLLKTYVLPNVLINFSPLTSVDVFNFCWDASCLSKPKSTETNVLYSIERMISKLTVDLEQLLIYEAHQELVLKQQQGAVVIGAHRGNAIAIFAQTVAAYFMFLRLDSRIDKKIKEQFTRCVVEEEIHHQDYKLEELAKREVSCELILKKPTIDNISKGLSETTQIEEDVGIKDLVEEVLEHLPPEQELIKPFYEAVHPAS